MKQRLTYLVLIMLACATIAYAGPAWHAEITIDNIRLFFAPNTEKALMAAKFAEERISEIKETEEEDALPGIYAVQDMLTTIEEHLDIKGNAHKALKKQQQIEDKVITINHDLTGLTDKAKTEEYKLALTHAALRTEILLDEVALAKQKTKAKLK